jgi:hypothetical protein
VSFEPPPADLPIELDHDGVVWTIGARSGAAPLAGVAVGGGLVLVDLAVTVTPWAGFGAALAFLVAAALGTQVVSRTRVRVNDRAVVVEERGLRGTIVTRVPLDELASLTVAERDDEVQLVLRTRERTLVVGAGRPRDELEWIVGAVAAAQEAFGRREQAEGREWTFLRKVPEGLTRLRE